MTDTPAARLDAIRRLNDAARARPGATCIANMTAGIAELPADQRAAIVRLVATFDHWTEDNDPHGEHDFGTLYRLASGEWTQARPDDADQIAQTAFWKLDYYDKALRYGSEQPWNAEATARVLTIMLASEY